MNDRVGSSDAGFGADAGGEEVRRRYTTLLGVIDDGVLQLDAAGRVVDTNDAFLESTGFDRDDLLGEDVSAVIDESGAEWLRGCLAGDEEDDADREAVESTVRTSEGGTLTCELRADTVVEGDTVTGAVCVVREVGERTSGADADVERELRRYETIVETVEDGVYIVDEDGHFTMVNDAYAGMLGYDREALLGEHVSTVVGQAVVDRVREVEAAMREDAADSPAIRAELQTASGDTVPAEARFALLTADDGTERRVGVVRDLSDREARERELQRKERRYEAVFEDPNILVGLLEPDGTVLDINQTAMEYIEADLSEITGEPFWETPWWGVSDDVREDVREWTERAADGEYVDFEADLRRPDGEPYTLSGYFRPVTDEDGEVVSIIVSDRDVTERKQRERELEESERRYRTLVENFPNGAVALVDEDVRYRTVGGSPTDTGDVTIEEAEGTPVAEAVPPEVAERLVPAYEAALDGDSESFEIERDGRYFHFQVVPVRDDDGEVFAALGMSQDVTEREEAKRKLERSERRYRTLVENFPNGAVGLFDENLEYQVAGGQGFERVDADRDDVVGETLWDRYPEEVAERLEPKFRAALEGESSEFEWEFHDRVWHAHTVPIRDEQGDVFAGMIMVQDVSERREYERRLETAVEQLEASNERLEQFAYAASHDLQEPLRMVSSYLQLLERRYGDDLDEEAGEFIDFAVDGAERMRDMIDGLLTYSRVETEGDPLVPTDLDDVFDDVVADLQVKIEETGAEVTADDLPTVEGDASQLRQLFQNLLENALEYSTDGSPRVHVSADRRGDQWVVSVADEGIGVDPDDADRIFEVFQRLHTQDEHPGTGIGLALCRRIVERHGGDIWVDSDSGEGSTFSFTLPVVDDEGRSR